MASVTLSTLYSDALRSITGFLCLSEIAAMYRCCWSLRDQLESIQPATSMQLRTTADLPKSIHRLRTWITHLSLSVDSLLRDFGERRLAAAVPNLTSLRLSFSDDAYDTEGDLDQLYRRRPFNLPASLHALHLQWWAWPMPSQVLILMLAAAQQFGAITSLTLEGRDQPFPSESFLEGLHALGSLTRFKLVFLDRGVVRSLIKLSRVDIREIVTHPTLTSIDLQEGHLSEAFMQSLLTDAASDLRSRLQFLRIDPRWINTNVKSLRTTLDGICPQLRH